MSKRKKATQYTVSRPVAVPKVSIDSEGNVKIRLESQKTERSRLASKFWPELMQAHLVDPPEPDLVPKPLTGQIVPPPPEEIVCIASPKRDFGAVTLDLTKIVTGQIVPPYGEMGDSAISPPER